MRRTGLGVLLLILCVGATYAQVGDDHISWAEAAEAAPATPAGLAYEVISADAVRISWTNQDSGAQLGFTLDRAQSSSGPWDAAAGLDGSAGSFLDEGLQPATGYYYRLRAFNSGGYSGYLAIGKTTPTKGVRRLPTFCADLDAPCTSPDIVSGGSTDPPAAPSNLDATAMSSTSISVIWTDRSDNENRFILARCQGVGCSVYSQIAYPVTNAQSYLNTGLTADTSYSYKILAQNNVGYSAYSNIDTAVTLGAVPAAPTGLNATAFSGTQINLAWTDASTNETGFRVESGPNATSFSELPGMPLPAGSTSYQHTGLTPSTQYFYRVRASNASGNSGYSNTDSDTTLGSLPAPPTNLNAVGASSTSIDLTWTDNATNESAFRMERSLTGQAGTFAPLIILGPDSTTHTDTGLTTTQTYYYRVLCYNAEGDSAWSNVSSAMPTGAAPTAPSGLVATAQSSTSISLSWTDNSTNETGFKLERSLTATPADFVQVGTPTSSPHLDTGLSASTTYYYRIRATNANGDSAYSAQANATTLAPPVIAPPTNLQVTAVSQTQINLTWDDNSADETAFKIERAPAVGGQYAEIHSTAADVESYSNTGLTASTFYCYRVRATDGTGFSAYSSVACATTQGAQPAAPSGLQASGFSSTVIRLTWTDNATNETGFEVWRSTTQAGTYTQIGSPAADAVTYDNTGLSAAQTFWYQVRAVNGSGNSSYAGPVAGTTLGGVPGAPTNLTANAISTSEIVLNWTDNSSNETDFRILQRKDSCAGGVTGIFTVTAPPYTNTGLVSGTMYCYLVQAHNAAGYSGPSNGASATTQGPTGDSTAPSVPQNVVLKNLSCGNITLTWNASTDEPGGSGLHTYKVYRDAVFVTESVGTSFAETLTANHQYVDYTISAADVAGNESARSASVSGVSGFNVLFCAGNGTLGVTYQWAKRFQGQAGGDIAEAVAIDPSGNVIVAGTFRGTVDFGGNPLVSTGGKDLFLAEYTSTGSYIWSRKFGTASDENALGIVTDASGNIYLLGSLIQPGIDFGGGPLLTGGPFVVRLDTNGAYGGWFVELPGSYGFEGGIAIGADGHVVAGTFNTVRKLNGASGAEIWPITWPASVDIRAVEIDPADNSVVFAGNVATWTGSSVNFGGGVRTAGNTGTGAVDSSTDVFIVKLTSGGAHSWSEMYGFGGGLEDGFDVANSLAIGPGGTVLMAGQHVGGFNIGGSCTLPDPGGIGNETIWLAKFNATGSAGRPTCLWAKSVDRSQAAADTPIVNGMTVNASGEFVIAGSTRGLVINFGAGVPSPLNSLFELFLVKYASDGSHIWTQIYAANATAKASRGSVLGGEILRKYGFGNGDLDVPYTANGDVFILKVSE